MEPRNISIAVYDQNKESIDKSSNASERYLILSNEELSNKNREYIVELETLKNENESLEDQNGKLETSTRYMRGILHNFTEKVKHQEKLIKHYKTYHSNLKEYTKSINTLIKNTNDFIKKIFLVYNMILLTLCFSGGITFFAVLLNNILVAMALGITVAQTQLDYTLILNIEEKTKSINELQKTDKQVIENEEKKIAEIDKSNNFIEEYIEVV